MRPHVMMLVLVSMAACATGGADTRSSATPGSAPPPVRVPERGEHVRVVFPAGPNQPERYLAGYLYRLSPDTVIMARGTSADTVLLSEGRQLQTVVRTRHKGKTGMLLGMVGGIVVGGAVGSAAYEPCVATGGWFDMSCLFAPTQGEMTAGGAVLGGLAGGLVGYIVGAAIRTEEWGTVPLAGGRVRVASNGLGLRIAF